MLICEYGSKDFENKTMSAIQAKQPFSVKINGWKKCPISIGLRHYLRYLDSRQQGKTKPIFALLMIPFCFVTPTFWVLCVRAEFEKMYPNVQQSNDALMINFESLRN